MLVGGEEKSRDGSEDREKSDREKSGREEVSGEISGGNSAEAQG